MLKIFKREKKETNKSHIEAEIDAVIEEMAVEHADTDKYSTMAENLEKLCRAKSYEKNFILDKNTILTVVGTTLTVALILNFEKADVLTSKALGFVKKV